MTRRGDRWPVLMLFLLYLVSAVGYTQDTTLVYEPDIQLGAGGPISFLEERTDGELARRAELSSPGVFTQFVQRRYADGGMHRLVWFYDDTAGNYVVEEQDSQPDGSWTVAATLDYENDNLTRARFYSGDNLIEERMYEYDDRGRVTKELTTKVSEEYPVLLDFDRPADDTIEAYDRQPDGSKALVARLQYDDGGRLILDERFVKDKLKQRDVYQYNQAGKLVDHVRYDYRELPVRHVTYGYTEDGLPFSVVHRDVKDRVLFGVSYSRETLGESSRTTIKDGNGEVTGTIDYIRRNGKDISRTEVFLLGSGKLEITYSEFDEYGNWLLKELVTYDSNSVKERSVTRRVIRYFD